MRYIPKKKIQDVLPSGWEDKARTATAEIRSLSPDQRKQKIEQKALWRELRSRLKEVMHGKCWYCESKQCRTDNPIDHFRPKNSVSECETHSGYWWLAFDWKNYRYCCDYCNSHGSAATRGTPGGKHDHFPLLDESRRAMTEEDDIGQEQPLLLDPLCAADPCLLWFNEDGSASPHPRCGHDPDTYLHKRATASIGYYHLNQPDIQEGRAVVCRKIKDLLLEADEMYARYSRGDQTAREAYARDIDRLHSMIKEDAEYSMTAISMLKGLRETYPTADAVLSS